MIEYWREDRRVNDHSFLRPGMQAMMVYRFGVWQTSLQRGIASALAYRLYRLAHIFVRNFYGIELYASARIGHRLRIAHQSGIVLHPELVMGDDCLIRQGVSIGRASNHGGGIRARAPVIGNRVEIGAGAVIVGGITIGDDVVIGPNAVVLRSVPSGALVTTTPARVIGRPPRGGKEESQPPAPPSAEEPQ
jgi:serine O-acetyltransferase